MPEYRWAVDEASGEFLYGGLDPYDVSPGLSAGQIRVVFDSQYGPPDARLHRYDAGAASKRRDATAAEIAVYDRRQEATRLDREHGDDPEPLLDAVIDHFSAMVSEHISTGTIRRQYWKQRVRDWARIIYRKGA